jgi:putative oxidoreductase
MALDVWAPRIRSILRIVAGLMFMMHGTQKLLGWPIPPHGGQSPPLMSMMGIAGLIELIGGILIVIGLFTRIASFIASGEMAAAYFIAHAREAFWPIANQGELPVLYCFLFLYFFFAGAGPWSIDAMMNRGRARPAL